ncbi:hypothetical protein [Tautonia plasticadhaerens]|uniref:Prenyltransferase and squalene oxidase repeat protein n=1 Tax=Tautonia plasticadhaerens TaxID=2527974 RepID=A0A518HBL8_9BACT|nr:hypothetical protein [Tautonia plasticadhaerens]QDV38255.1 hypothetical protein ElP_62060 [Tautonia plasticadhaerens]
MTGLNLEPFLRLLRADVGAWASLGVVALLVGLIAWTGWGSRRILRKCLVLSVLAHVGLAFFGGDELSRLIAPGMPDGTMADEPGIREIRVRSPLGDSGVEESSGRPGSDGRGGALATDADLAAFAFALPTPEDPGPGAIRPGPVEPEAPLPLAFDEAEAPRLDGAAPRADLVVRGTMEERPMGLDPGPEPASEIVPSAVDPAEVAEVVRPDRPAPDRAPPPLPDLGRLAARPEGPRGGAEVRPPARPGGMAPLPDLELPDMPTDPGPVAGDRDPAPGAAAPAGPMSGAEGGLEPASADPDAVAAPIRLPEDRPSGPTLPEADLRDASRPRAEGGEAAGGLAGRLASREGPDLGRFEPGALLDLPDLPGIGGAPGGRPLLDVPAVYRPRLDPNRSALARRAGASAASEEAVERALDWLSRHQDADGRWDAGTARFRDGSAPKGEDSFTAHCPPADLCSGECYYWEADTAVTGLALLAFLGSGYSHTEGKYETVVGRGVDFLLASQGPDGDLRGPSRAVGMYCHAMATLALSEAYALSGDPKLKGPVVRAVGFLAEATYPGLMGWRYAPNGEIRRSPSEDGRGWDYDPHPPIGDTSVLGWVVMVLKSASEVGVAVPPGAVQSARNWLTRVEDGDASGLARYQPSRPADPVMTAEAWVCRQFLGIGGPGAASDEAAGFLLQNLPTADAFNAYYWYYATLAMYQAGGRSWDRWNASVRDSLVGLQRRDGHKAGSWDPDPTRYGTHGGRVYATALATLSLEVYYRYLRLYTPEAAAGMGPGLSPSPGPPGDGPVRRAGGGAVR